MKNRVKVTIAALAVGLLTVCTGITGYAVEDQGVSDEGWTYESETYTGWDGEIHSYHWAWNKGFYWTCAENKHKNKHTVYSLF